MNESVAQIIWVAMTLSINVTVARKNSTVKQRGKLNREEEFKDTTVLA